MRKGRVEEFEVTVALEALNSFAVSATKQLRASVQEKWGALEKGTVTFPDGEAVDRCFVVKTVVEARLGANRESEYATTCGERNLGEDANY